jgi:hypothetical protein
MGVFSESSNGDLTMDSLVIYTPKSLTVEEVCSEVGLWLDTLKLQLLKEASTPSSAGKQVSLP